MNRILILKAYYKPESIASSYITDNLIEDLIESNYCIDLVTPVPSRGVSSDTRDVYKKRKIEKAYNGSLKIYRFRMFKEYKNHFLRALRYFLSSFSYIFISLKLKDIDYIFASSTPPTMGLVAGIISKLKRVPFIFSLQDVFPDSLISTGLTKQNSIFCKIGRIIENMTYELADKIIVISDDFKENIIKKGVEEEKIKVIYNWVDEKKVIPIKRDDNILIKKYNLKKDKFYIVYAGNLGHAQNIEVIINAAKELTEYKDIEILIFGKGQQEDYYKNMVKELGVKNIAFFPLQPYDLVSHVYSLGNASIVTCKKGLGKSAMPSKTWSIMSAGTAVIANFDADTDLERIINKNHLGVFTESNDHIALKDAILRLYWDEKETKMLGINGRKYIINNLTRLIQTNKYKETFRELEDK